MKLELTKRVKIGNRYRAKGTVMEIANERSKELLANKQAIVYGSEFEKIVTQSEGEEE